MARNKKFRTAAIRFGPALKAFLLCLMIGGSGVGYVWQKTQINQLNDLRKRREVRLRILGRENEELRRQLQELQQTAYIKQKINLLKLGLAPAASHQIWRITEPSAEPSKTEDRQYAAQDGGDRGP
jgi:hypothetical protein